MMSLTKSVPAAVPLLFHSSGPRNGSLARKNTVPFTFVAPRYFETFGMQWIEGRDFQFEDAARPPVAIVNEAMARRYFGARSPLGRMQRGNRLGQAARGAETEETPRVDVERFVGRVTKAFHTAQQRGGTLQLRLSPPELGSLRLELSVRDGVMTAALETETQAARRVLLDHLPALRDRPRLRIDPATIFVTAIQ